MRKMKEESEKDIYGNDYPEKPVNDSLRSRNKHNAGNLQKIK